MKKKNNKGFSLIELIIAIAILVILTGLLAPQFMRYMEKSREAKDMQTLDTIYGAAQAALSEEKAYQAAKADVDLTTTGLELSTLLLDTNADAFAKEFRLNTGALKAADLWSCKAITDVLTTAGGKAVYVQVDKDLKVTVWAGKPASSTGAITEGDVVVSTDNAKFLISR